MPKPRQFVGIGFADAQRGAVVVGLRHTLLQHEHRRRAAADAGERALQGTHLRERVDRIAQRVAPGAQLLRLQRLALGDAGLLALRGHQHGDDRIDDQHRSEQQGMLAQVDRERMARWYEGPS